MLIVSHNGQFHADDVNATMVLLHCHQDRECKVVRTRDPEIIARADAAVDVGGVSDPTTLRFDHHQKGFSESRPSGVVYASAGLVWKQFGAAFVMLSPAFKVSSKQLNRDTAQAIADMIDEDYIQYLDMADTGASIPAPGLYGASSSVALHNVTMLDEMRLRSQISNSEEMDAALKDLTMQRFMAAMREQRETMFNIINHKLSEHEAADVVRTAQVIEQGRIMVLPMPNLEWSSVVHKEFPDVLFVVYPDSSDSQYQIRTVTLNSTTYDNRKALPVAWAGLRGADLAAVTGVEDSVFCHNGRFIAGAISLDGAVALAKLALA